jgi:hypothetical protein
MKTRTGLALIVSLAAASLACEQDLGQAFENVRAAAPAVCKDYCEEKASCEWPKADGPEEDAAYSYRIRQCTVSCAWYMSEGSFVTEYTPALEQIDYVDSISGGAIEDALKCVYDAGAYHCVENEDGPDSHVFEPRLEIQCETCADCLESLGIDFTLRWDTNGGGSCVPDGQQRVDQPFL